MATMTQCFEQAQWPWAAYALNLTHGISGRLYTEALEAAGMFAARAVTPQGGIKDDRLYGMGGDERSVVVMGMESGNGACRAVLSGVFVMVDGCARRPA